MGGNVYDREYCEIHLCTFKLLHSGCSAETWTVFFILICNWVWYYCCLIAAVHGNVCNWRIPSVCLFQVSGFICWLPLKLPHTQSVCCIIWHNIIVIVWPRSPIPCFCVTWHCIAYVYCKGLVFNLPHVGFLWAGFDVDCPLDLNRVPCFASSSSCLFSPARLSLQSLSVKYSPGLSRLKPESLIKNPQIVLSHNSDKELWQHQQVWKENSFSSSWLCFFVLTLSLSVSSLGPIVSSHLADWSVNSLYSIACSQTFVGRLCFLCGCANKATFLNRHGWSNRADHILMQTARLYANVHIFP